MGISVFPAPAASSKTMYRTTLTSGTSYTVPANVTYLNVTLIGGAGSGGTTGFDQPQGGMPGEIISSTLAATAGATISYSIGAGAAARTGSNENGTTGGTTTFTGATSAAGGLGGAEINTGTGRAGTNGSYANNAAQAVGGNRPSGAGGNGAIIVEYWA